jgi:glutamate racemase
MNSNGPIGLFDSGVGGLTIARAVARRLPHRQLLYFGDTAHLPYGDKSPEAIRSYALSIADYLIAHGAVALVVACNTASAVAMDALRAHVPAEIPIINVIDPVVAAVAQVPTDSIGVIGTRGTIGSGIYPERIRAAGVRQPVHTLATPLLVPIIEEGLAHSDILRATLHHYLAQPELQGIDTLIPGCTHYPLLTDEINAFYRDQHHTPIAIIDAPSVVAEAVAAALEAPAATGNKTNPKYEDFTQPASTPAHRFFVSDYTPTFEKIAQQFFGKVVKLELA